MSRVLKGIDFYGITYEFGTKGEDKFKTWFGGCMSIFTVISIMAFGYLFGKDFYHKTNPRVVNQERIYTQTKLLKPNTKDHTILFRLHDGGAKNFDLSLLPYGIRAMYTHMKKDDKGEWISYASTSVASKPCDFTDAKLNPSLASENLSFWTCIDWSLIAENTRAKLNDTTYEPILGGDLDEDELAFIRLDISNWAFNASTGTNSRYIKPSDYPELVRRFGLRISIRYTNAVFNSDSLDEPIQSFFQNELLEIRPQMYIRETNYFQRLVMKDDIGWIFNDVKEVEVLQPDYKIKDSYVNDLSVNATTYFYFKYFYLGKKEKIITRNYMKVQELTAIVGGFIKFVMMIFGFIARLYAEHIRMMMLVEDLYDYKEPNFPTPVRQEHSIEEQINREQGSDTIVPKRKKSDKEIKQIDFFGYYTRCFRRNNAFKVRLIEFTEKKRHLEERTDIEFLLRHFEKFSKLQDMLLTSEQISELNSMKRSQISRFNISN